MLEHTIREVKIFLFFFPEMRLYFLMFISAVCFLFLLLRYVQLFFTNSNQSRSEFIPTPNFYFICQCLLYLFVGIWQSLVSVYLCLRVDDTAASFSRRGLGAVRSLFSKKQFYLFVSGGVVLCFFRGLFFIIAGFVTKDGLITLQ